MATALPVPPGGTTGARQTQGVPQPTAALAPPVLIPPIGPTIFRQGVGGAITAVGSLTSTGLSLRSGSGTVSAAGSLTGAGHGDGAGQVNGTGTLTGTGRGLGTGAITGAGALTGTGRNPLSGGSNPIAFANPRPHEPARVVKRASGSGAIDGIGVVIADGHRRAAGEGAAITAIGSCDAAGISLRRGAGRIRTFASTAATGYRDHHAERHRRHRLEDELLLLVDL